MKCALLQSSPGKLITLSGRGCRWLKISCTEVPPLLRGFAVPPLVDLPFLFYGPLPPTLLSKTEKYEVMEVLFQNYFGLVTYLHVLDPKNTHTAHMNASALPRNVRKQYCSLVCLMYAPSQPKLGVGGLLARSSS